MVIKKNSKEAELKHKARRISIKEGVLNRVNLSFGSRYLSPFAIAINASNSLVAMLSAVTGLIGPFSQTLGSKLMEKYSRKKIVLKSVFFESLIWIPIILIGIFFWLDIITEVLPIILLLFFSFQIFLSNMGHPAWFSWIGDIVDEKYRGKWFSKRNLLAGFVSVILSIISAFMLDYFKKQNKTIIGFIILFSLAMIFRILVWKTFKKQYEPKLKLKKDSNFSFWEFLVKMPKTNFGRFTIFRGLLSFSISISSPLIAIYLLRDLNFSYTFYILIIAAGTFFSLLFLEIWGKIADKYGNRQVLKLTAVIIPLIPLLWILSPSPLYLIFIPSTISGIAYGGFLLASGNFIYDNVKPEKRGRAISYFNMIIGKGVFLGAGLGALLIKFVAIEIIEPIFFIFIIGSLARLLVVYTYLPEIKEIKKTKKFKGTKSIKEIFMHETKQTLIEETHQIMHLKKYLSS